MDKIRSLRLFVAALDEGSFAAAARRHGSDPSTVSKAISRLETDLGVQLLQRSTRQLRLTSAGNTYAETARRLLDELGSCEDQLKQLDSTPTGTLRLSVPVSYGRLYVRPLLARFCRRYPGISIDIQFDDAYTDIIRDGIDISIRSGSLQDSSLVARQLSPIDFLICASPDYLAGLSVRPEQDQLHLHRWIRFRFPQSGRLLPVLTTTNAELIEQDPDRSYIVNDGEAMAELCADGMGLTQIPHFIARNWLQSGRLTALFPALTHPGSGVYLVYPKRHQVPGRVRAFLSFFSEAIMAGDETPLRTWAQDIG